MSRATFITLLTCIAASTPLLGGCTVGFIGDLAQEQATGAGESPGDGGGGSGGLGLPSGGGGHSTGGSAAGGGSPEEPVGEAGFALITAGTFTMGSPPDDPHNAWWNGFQWEKQHQVTLTHDFLMAETEVTQQQWLDATGSNPSVFAACGLDCPVENITWYQMVWFCNLKSQQAGLEACYRDEGDGSPYDADDANAWRVPSWPQGYDCAGYRLPTEAEWEYATRAGTTTPHFLGAESHENTAKSAWYGPNSQCQYTGCDNEDNWKNTGAHEPSGTHPVAQKQPNPWGLYDTSGNVWEFVWDFFGEYHDGTVTDPVGPMANQAGYHVARGGAWISLTLEARSATRDGDDATGDPDNGPGCHTGFRICRTRP